jgi:hypothetical protein
MRDEGAFYAYGSAGSEISMEPPDLDDEVEVAIGENFSVAYLNRGARRKLIEFLRLHTPEPGGPE